MSMVKIRFKNDEDDTRGFYELMKRTRVLCFAHDVYQVPKSALKILDRKGLQYEILSEEGLDHAYKALRDSVTSKV